MLISSPKKFRIIVNNMTDWSFVCWVYVDGKYADKQSIHRRERESIDGVLVENSKMKPFVFIPINLTGIVDTWPLSVALLQ